MADEIIKTEDLDAQGYVDKLNELKSTMVDKEKYDKLVEEKKVLADALLNGAKVDIEQQKKPADIDALRKELLNTNMTLTNLDYATKVIELRNALIEKGEPDPFMPQGSKYTYDVQDEVDAQMVAEALQHCIDKAEGDPDVFNNELTRIMVDTTPQKINKNRR